MDEQQSHLQKVVREQVVAPRQAYEQLQCQLAERKRAEAALVAAEAAVLAAEQGLAERVAEQTCLLTGIYEVILVAGPSYSTGDLQPQVVGRIIGVVAGDAECIQRWDQPSATLPLRVQRGLSPDMQKHIAALPPAWLLEDRTPRTVTEVTADPSVPPALRLSGLGAYLGIPISLRGRVTGTLSILWHRRVLSRWKRSRCSTRSPPSVAIYGYAISASAVATESGSQGPRRDATRADPLAQIPACPSDINAPLFDTIPIDPNDVLAFRPLGFMSPPVHMFPAEHSALSMTPPGQKPVTRPVRAPGRVWVVEIWEAMFSTGGANYQVFMYPCRDVRVYFGHIASLAEKLVAELKKGEPKCNSFFDGPATVTTRRYENRSVLLEAGEQFGVGPDSAGVQTCSRPSGSPTTWPFNE